MKKYNLLFVLGLTAVAGQAQTGYGEAAREIKVVGDAAPVEQSQATATPVSLLYYVIEGKHHFALEGCVPNSTVELYSARSGGERVVSRTADDKGSVAFSFNSRPKVAFALNDNTDNRRAVAGSKQVSAVSGAELTAKDLKVSAIGNDVRVSWNAALANSNWSFVVQRSRDNRRFEDVETLTPQVGSARSYSVSDQAPGDAAQLYYRVEARHQSGFKALVGEDLARFTAKPFFQAIPTVFEQSVQLIMDGSKLPAVYTVTDMAGRIKYASGTLNNARQQVSLNLQPGSYIISVVDKKGQVSSQLLIRN